MNKLLLVDGHNLLFQMFFGMPSRIINKDGKAIQGTLGFVGALLKIIRMVNPSHMLVLFDSEQENPRGELREDYKANRADYSLVPEEDCPFSQLPDIYAALDYLGIPHTEVIGVEADDVVASYAIQFGADMQVVIASFDSDFFQLINETVTILRYRGDNTILCDCAYIQNKLGISPCQYADFKSLTGDPSDHIKGANKVGPKTAAQLLNQFGKLEQLLACAEQITKPSVRQSIIDNAERLKVNLALIRLDGNAPLPFPIQELLYDYDGITTNDVLAGIGLR